MNEGRAHLRPFSPADTSALIAGRDDESRRWLGAGSDEPHPTACIVVENVVVGWVDFDSDRTWLDASEVNIGYSVFPEHRGRGYASAAVELLLHQLATSTAYDTATLLIDPNNTRSLAVARKLGFQQHGEIDGQQYFKRTLHRPEAAG